MIVRFFLKLFTIIILVNCSSSDNNKKSGLQNIQTTSPENQYVNAMSKFDKGQYEEAVIIFQNIEKIYPLSNEAIQSQIMSGFIDYIKLDYDSAISKFDRVIKKYPSLKNIDYVFYMKAICFYEQISHESLDGEYNDLALTNLNQVINRFPESKYAKDSRQKIILVKSNIAAKHIAIGRFYQKNKKYTAALNRYQIVIDNFSETKFTPEALYRISEIYYSIGMINEATKTAAVLGHNYPQSNWYKFSYENLSKDKKNKKIIDYLDKILNKNE